METHILPQTSQGGDRARSTRSPVSRRRAPRHASAQVAAREGATMNRKLIERGVCMIIEGLLDAGETDHNFDDTPRRVADVYEELFVPRKSNHNVVFDEDYTDVVLVRGHV